MKLINQTKQTILANHVIQAKTLHEQTLGMLAFSEPKALVIKTRFGIHTFFMKYPIDILILDKSNRVAIMKENIQPNKIFVWNPFYATVLELPPKTISRSKTAICDKIKQIRES